MGHLNRRKILGGLFAGGLFTAAVAMVPLASARAASAVGQSAVGQSAAAGAADVRKQTSVVFPTAGVRLDRPEGFAVATSFEGFQQTATRASVLTARIPGPFAQATIGFDAKKMAERGMRLKSKGAIKVAGRDGLLLRLTQTASGTTYGKWIVAFPDASDGTEGTVLVTATFLEAQAAKLSDKMKAAALSARPEPRKGGGEAERHAPGLDLPFTLSHKGTLKPTPVGIGKSLVLTRDGALPAKPAPAEPLFVVAPSLGPVTVPDPHEFALQRLQETAHTKEIEVVSDGTLRVDGLDGYEIVAKAKDAGSGVPLTVYQAMLFDSKKSSYILMQGLVGAESAGEYLPEFKALTRSLKRRPATTGAAAAK